MPHRDNHQTQYKILMTHKTIKSLNTQQVQYKHIEITIIPNQ